jgi:hypothetical protein
VAIRQVETGRRIDFPSLGSGASGTAPAKLGQGKHGGPLGPATSELSGPPDRLPHGAAH